MRKSIVIGERGCADRRCVPASAQQGTVKIGLIMPYSGQFADTATQMDNAIKLYMKQNGDTVAGKKIEIIRKDSGGIAPDVAKRLAQELITRDKVDIFGGLILTPNALAVGDVSASAKKFTVIMNAATSIITTKSPYMARTSVTTPMLNQTLGTWAVKKGGAKKIYSMVSDFGPGHDAEGAFQLGVKEAGGEINNRALSSPARARRRSCGSRLTCGISGSSMPILGVCLGHQCIGAAYGADIVRAGRPLHGRTSPVVHDGSSIFAGLPSPLRVARYHSLVIARASLPESLRVIASAQDDGEIMAVEHRTHPVIGVQFHPESAASEHGYAMLDRFLHGDRLRASELPNRADGMHAAAEAAPPWAARDDDVGGRFVPPSVELVRDVPPRTHGVEPAAASGERGRLSAVWVNGERQPSDGLHVSASDRGLTLADGVFETMRAESGAVFRLDRHLARLMSALAALEIPARPELREWLLWMRAGSGVADVSVRLTVTRGPGAGGVAPSLDARPTVIVAINPLPMFPAAIYDVGLTAHVASGRRNERAMTAGLKTLGYTDAVAAWLEAHRAGADEAIFLDTESHCSEATSSNVFIWTGSILLTPPISCGALPGITREAVLELATSLGVPNEERTFGLADLVDAEEAFLTSSLRGVAPLVRVDAHPIGRGTPGALTRKLAAAYSARFVAQECGR